MNNKFDELGRGLAHCVTRRLAISRDNGNLGIWDLDKVNQILAQLGLNP
jgi:hypothetical protein